MPLSETLSHRLELIQRSIFPHLKDAMGPLPPRYERFILILETVLVEELVPHHGVWPGRPLKDRASIARAFVARSFFGLATVRALIDRLEADARLRRLCGWTHAREVPSESTFSRAFREFAVMRLAERAHAAMIGRTLGSRSVHEGHDEPGPDRVIGHVSRDSTAISARETPARKERPPKAKGKPAEAKRKRGRPRKGEERPPKPETRLRRQLGMTLPEMLEDLPKDCDWSCKRNSAGKTESWKGYKSHIDTCDGGVPVSFILTSASVHDSQAAIPLAEMTAGRITHLYELMDSAYDAPEIRKRIEDLGRKHIIDTNPRRDSGLKQAIRDEARARRLLNLTAAEDVRYRERSAAERANARLKDEFGGRSIWVRGHEKVGCHLGFGLLVLAADQLLRLLI